MYMYQEVSYRLNEPCAQHVILAIKTTIATCAVTIACMDTIILSDFTIMYNACNIDRAGIEIPCVYVYMWIHARQLSGTVPMNQASLPHT